MPPNNWVNMPVDVQLRDRDINKKLQLFGIYSAFALGKLPSNRQIHVALNSALESKPLQSPSSRLSADGKRLVGDLRNVIEQAKFLILSKNEGDIIQDFIWQTTNLSSDGTNPSLSTPVTKEKAEQNGREALSGLRTLGSLLITNGQFCKLLNDAIILLRTMVGDAGTQLALHANPTEQQLAQINSAAEDNSWHELPNISNYKSQIKDKYNKNKQFWKKQPSSPNTSDLLPKDSSIPESPNGSLNAQSRLVKWKAQNKRYLNEKIPKETREQTLYRLRKMIVEIQGHEDYQRAIETLLKLAEEYSAHSKSYAKDAGGKAKGFVKSTHVQTAQDELKLIVERFANSTSSDDLFDSINEIYRAADRDPELKKWFVRLDAYIRKCLQEQGYVLQDAAEEESKVLYKNGSYLIREKYRPQFDGLISEITAFSQQFESDPLNKAFGDSVQKLFLDIGQDEAGNVKFKPQLIKDMTDVIIPSFLESVRYVPIPRLEYSDKSVDLVVENLVVEVDNIAPNVMELTSDNYWRWGRKHISNHNKNRFVLTASGIQTDLKNVSYYFKRKEGFPKITDTGLVDIRLGGNGLSFTMELETPSPNDTVHYFKVKKVNVGIENLKVKLRKSKLKILFNLARPFMMTLIRPIVSRVVEAQLKKAAKDADALLYQARQDANKSRMTSKNDASSKNAQSMFSAYANALKANLELRKQNAKAIKESKPKSDAKFNIALTQLDSIFPDVKVPRGISSKATEYRELAAKGNKWESPVFSLGSAKESNNIPKVSPITRKSKAKKNDANNQLRSKLDLGASAGAEPPGAVSVDMPSSGGVSDNLIPGAGAGQGRSQPFDSSTSGFRNEVYQAFGGSVQV